MGHTRLLDSVSLLRVPPKSSRTWGSPCQLLPVRQVDIQGHPGEVYGKDPNNYQYSGPIRLISYHHITQISIMIYPE